MELVLDVLCWDALVITGSAWALIKAPINARSDVTH